MNEILIVGFDPEKVKALEAVALECGQLVGERPTIIIVDEYCRLEDRVAAMLVHDQQMKLHEYIGDAHQIRPHNHSYGKIDFSEGTTTGRLPKPMPFYHHRRRY